MIASFQSKAPFLATRYTLRSFAYRAPLIARLPNAPASQPKPKQPATVWEVLRKPPRQTRVVLIGLAVFLAGGVTILNSKPPAKSDQPFNPQSFSPFTLTSRETVSSTSSVLTLKPQRLPKSGDPYAGFWQDGLWSLEFKQPQLQIARSYTPLPPLIHSDSETNGPASELRFLIRHDGQGEVSTYLNNLPTGSTVELRGPRIEFQLPAEIDEIVFLAGGTGVGPALQTLQTLLVRKAETGLQMPRVKLLWANRKREDCVGGTTVQEPESPTSLWHRLSSLLYPVKQDETQQPIVTLAPSQNPIVRALSALESQNPDQVSVEYFVDEEKTRIDSAAIKRYMENLRKTPEAASGAKLHTGRRLIMVSGPDGFVDYLAGPKGWRLSVQVQGDLGGVLGQMKLDGWEVRKL